MLSTTSLVTKLQADFPSFTFTPSDEFRWSPEGRIIFYNRAANEPAPLLHELSHAILDHKAFTRDIKLVELERDAWGYAQATLARTYSVTVDTDEIEDALDTYRDWLHARSTCPTCQATGIQTEKNTYKCLACLSLWRVNDARVCALRRYKVR